MKYKERFIYFLKPSSFNSVIMKKNIAILFIAFMSGCSSGPSTVHNADDLVVVDLSHITDKANRTFDEMIDSVQIVKLQTTDNSLLSNVLKIELSDKYIYALDCQFGTIKIFTRDGDFFKGISKGRGPGELNDPSIIRYVESEEKLYVYQDGLINCYTDDGTFVERYNIPYLVDDFVKQGENFVCFQYSGRSVTQQSRIVEVNTNMEEVSSFIIEKEKLMFGMDNFSINHKGNINFFRPFDNNIYTYKDGKLLLSKQLDFDCPDYDLSHLESEVDYRGFNTYANSHSELLALSNFFVETNEYEMYNIVKGQFLNFTTVFRNKGNGEIVETMLSSVRKPSIINNLDYVGAYNNYFVAYCPFSKIEGRLDEVVNNDMSMSADDIEVFKNMTENDNPILVLFKMKNY